MRTARLTKWFTHLHRTKMWARHVCYYHHAWEYAVYEVAPAFCGYTTIALVQHRCGPSCLWLCDGKLTTFVFPATIDGNGNVHCTGGGEINALAVYPSYGGGPRPALRYVLRE